MEMMTCLSLILFLKQFNLSSTKQCSMNSESERISLQDENSSLTLVLEQVSSIRCYHNMLWNLIITCLSIIWRLIFREFGVRLAVGADIKPANPHALIKFHHILVNEKCVRWDYKMGSELLCNLNYFGLLTSAAVFHVSFGRLCQTVGCSSGSISLDPRLIR